MVASPYRSIRTRNTVTPQSEAIFGRESEMAPNYAGGVVFKLDPWAQLDRFLILGTDGPTYYASAEKLTKAAAKNVARLLLGKEDGLKVVQKVVEISQEGRAPKNEPALFVLAMASASDHLEVRKAALAALPQVA